MLAGQVGQLRPVGHAQQALAIDRAGRENWRIPPLAGLGRARMPVGRRIGMGALRLCLAAAMIVVIVRIVRVALGR